MKIRYLLFVIVFLTCLPGESSASEIIICEGVLFSSISNCLITGGKQLGVSDRKINSLINSIKNSKIGSKFTYRPDQTRKLKIIKVGEFYNVVIHDLSLMPKSSTKATRSTNSKRSYTKSSISSRSVNNKKRERERINDLNGAIRSGNISTIKEILNSGIDVNQTYALSSAIHAKNPYVIKILLANGADPNHGYQKGGSIYLAAKQDSQIYFDTLLNYGADLDVEDPRDTSVISTPLIKAIYENELGAAKRLLSHGANPNKISRMGNTALHQALLMHKEEFIKLLLQYGVNPSLKNRAGVTAERYAKLMNIDSISKLFGFEVHNPKKLHKNIDYPSDLEVLSSAYIAELLGVNKSYIKELNKDRSLYFLTSGNSKNNVITDDCRYIKGFIGATRKTPGVKIMLCAGGVYSPSNIDETIENQIASNKLLFGSMNKVGNNFRKLLGVDKFLINNNKGFIFVQVDAGHGMAIIPTVVIADEVSQTSLVVQLAGEEYMASYLTGDPVDISVKDISVNIFNRIKQN